MMHKIGTPAEEKQITRRSLANIWGLLEQELFLQNDSLNNEICSRDRRSFVYMLLCKKGN